jgi:hypothetical protein
VVFKSDTDPNSALLALIGSVSLQNIKLGQLLHALMFWHLNEIGIRNLYLEAAHTQPYSEPNKKFWEPNTRLIKYYIDLFYEISATDCENPREDWRKKFSGLTDPPRENEEMDPERAGNRYFSITSKDHGLAMRWCRLDPRKFNAYIRDIIQTISNLGMDVAFERK